MNCFTIVLIIAVLFALIGFSFLKIVESLINFIESCRSNEPDTIRTCGIVFNNETKKLEPDQSVIVPF